ncbi:fimbrial protein [Bacteroides hominis]|uniref:fimbrial protein n=1 Tax=Bacteroides hominis TaxID=2763023 RepID=UPI003D6AD6CE
MKKNYLMAMALASMVVGGVSCTKEVLETPDSAVVKGQTGKVVFRLDTGGSASFTRTTLSETESKITSLSVHLFKADGTSLTGYKKDYTEADISDSKLNVTIPTSLMGEESVKAYLVANVPEGESVTTETALQNFVSTIQAGDLSGGVIPMASPPATLNLSNPVTEVPVSMKRTMSAILVKIGDGADFKVGDFTYKLKDVRTDKGYLFKDMVVEGSISDLSPTPKSDGLLGYIYQSPAFTIEVAPKNGTSLASAGTRVVQVQANSAMKRNKKYVLTLLPKKAKESDPSSTGFTIEFEEWDSTDTFDVEWNTRVTLKKGLSTNLYEVKDNHLRLLPGGAIGSAGITDYGMPKSWLETTINGITITKVAMPSLMEDGAGIPAPTEGASFKTNWESHTPNLNDITGTLMVTTTNDKDKQESESEFDVTLEGQYITWKKDASIQKNGLLALQADNKGRAMNLAELYRYNEPTTEHSVADIFTLAEGWEIQNIRAKKTIEGRGQDLQLLINPDNNSDIVGATIKVALNTDKNTVTFRCGSKVRGYADIIVTIKKGDVTKERYLRITNRWAFK